MLKGMAENICSQLVSYNNVPYFSVGSWRGYFLAVALFAVNMFQLLVLQQYWVRCYQVQNPLASEPSSLVDERKIPFTHIDWHGDAYCCRGRHLPQESGAEQRGQEEVYPRADRQPRHYGRQHTPGGPATAQHGLVHATADRARSLLLVPGDKRAIGD